MADGKARIDVQGPLVFSFRAGPVPVVTEIYIAQGSVTFRRPSIQFQRTQSRGARFWDPFADREGWSSEHTQRVAIGQSSPRGGEIWIFGDGEFERFH